LLIFEIHSWNFFSKKVVVSPLLSEFLNFANSSGSSLNYSYPGEINFLASETSLVKVLD